ncbi:hypothetical protein PPN31119_03398 [Pandoraea pnomenusa]|jgi:hypothetical protein|uniref:Uncharacterized protein n=2 Tax=Pandoraea TaxID=93217 RepID=A0A378YMH0_9BURK|nr:Uncharacterised protein [Pandoraea pnomenusa]VVD94429.1 hypothetical protein PMO31116_01777 [Pandoraea morbifera]VVE69766.1 hypothetical protein PPN31119_03398 [Pandoraea pnomenusa]
MAMIGPICDGMVVVGTWAMRIKPFAQFVADVAGLL